VTIADALAAFDEGWIAHQGVTSRFSYRRTSALLGYWLEQVGRSASDDLATLAAPDMIAFVRWHAASGLVDDAAGTRKVALHVARTATWLAATFDRPDLAVDRAGLAGAVPLEDGTDTADR
jgi:hypothetical protein